MLILSSLRDSSSARRVVLLQIVHEQQEHNGQLGRKHGQVTHAMEGSASKVFALWQRQNRPDPALPRRMGRNNASRVRSARLTVSVS